MAAKPPKPPVKGIPEDQEPDGFYDLMPDYNQNDSDSLEEANQDGILLGALPKTPLQTQTAIQSIDKIGGDLTTDKNFHTQHPKAKYDDATHTLKEGKELLLEVKVEPQSKKPVTQVGSKATTAVDHQEQTISCVMPSPQKLGTNFIKELLKTTGKCDVDCASIEAAEKFIALAGAQADNLEFDFTKPQFKGFEVRITEAKEKAKAAAAPDLGIKLTPKSPSSKM